MSSENIDSNVSYSSSIILKEEFNDGFEPTKEGKLKKDFLNWLFKSRIVLIFVCQWKEKSILSITA